MLLAIDIGNTSTEIGIFSLEERKTNNLIANFRVITKSERTADEIGMQITSLTHSNNIESESIKGVICSNVVPSLDDSVSEMAEKYFNSTAMFVSHKIETGLIFKYPSPYEIGADRIVNTVAVNELYEAPAIIIDFGTATTFDLLSKKHEYLGGVITPGLSTSMEALTHKAAKLPEFEVIKPESILGKSTIHAMQSGIYYGAVYALEGIIQRLKKEHNLDNTNVVATGGFSQLINQGTQVIDILDSTLTLKGLEILFHKNIPKVF